MFKSLEHLMNILAFLQHFDTTITARCTVSKCFAPGTLPGTRAIGTLHYKILSSEKGLLFIQASYLPRTQ